MKFKSLTLLTTLLITFFSTGCTKETPKPITTLTAIEVSCESQVFTVGDLFSYDDVVVTGNFKTVYPKGALGEYPESTRTLTKEEYYIRVDRSVFTGDVELTGFDVLPKDLTLGKVGTFTAEIVAKENETIKNTYEFTVNPAIPTDYTAEEKKLMKDNLEGNVIPFMYVEGYEVVDYMEDWGCVSVEAPNGTVEIAEAYTAVLETLSDFVVTNDEPYDPDLIGYNCAYKVIDDETNALFIVEYYVLEGIWTVDGYIYVEPATPVVTEIKRSELRTYFVEFIQDVFGPTAMDVETADEECWDDEEEGYFVGFYVGGATVEQIVGVFEYMIPESTTTSYNGKEFVYNVNYLGMYVQGAAYTQNDKPVFQLFVGVAEGVSFTDDVILVDDLAN